MASERWRMIKDGSHGCGPVVYWMSRDQRTEDHWALLFSNRMAVAAKVPVVTVFCLADEFLGATQRSYGFMLRGLQEIQKSLEKKHVRFVFVRGEPSEEIPRFCRQAKAHCLVMDFDPLRLKRQWKQEVMDEVHVPCYEVDAHNIVPCWVVSSKQEFGAYTLRPKIKKLLPEYLEEFPRWEKNAVVWSRRAKGPDPLGWLRRCPGDPSVREVDWVVPGQRAAKKVLNHFIATRLKGYADNRNDPTRQGQSDLSPYLHFGQLSAQRVALDVLRTDAPASDKDAFLEELIVRRELSDNFCFYNQGYDSVEAFPSWAKKTLADHAGDRREYLYSREQLEQAATHDDLWNAAQTQMVVRGKMHGFMRMYWAKKILEWSRSPQEAMAAAVYLNDRYEIDGRDPNGYAGIAWAIGGVHDRAWGERSVFGKIRYMSHAGCQRKFDVSAYVAGLG